MIFSCSDCKNGEGETEFDTFEEYRNHVRREHSWPDESQCNLNLEKPTHD